MPWSRVLLVALVAFACGKSSPEPDPRHGLLEVIFAFTAKDAPGRYVSVDAAEVRRALAEGGEPDAKVESTKVDVDGRLVPGIRVRAPLRMDDDAARKETAAAAVRQRLGTTLVKLAWAGDRLFVRATAPVDERAVRTALDGAGLTVTRVQSWEESAEYRMTVSVAGPEHGFEQAIERRLAGMDATVASLATVGPQRR